MHFSQKLKAIVEVPTFWWEDNLVWIEDLQGPQLGAWSLISTHDAKVPISSPTGTRTYIVQFATLQECAESALPAAMTDAEFADVLEGCSLEESGTRAGVVISTRRKQFQGIFWKLDVVSQADLVRLCTQLIGRLATLFAAEAATDDSNFSQRGPLMCS